MARLKPCPFEVCSQHRSVRWTLRKRTPAAKAVLQRVGYGTGEPVPLSGLRLRWRAFSGSELRLRWRAFSGSELRLCWRVFSGSGLRSGLGGGAFGGEAVFFQLLAFQFFEEAGGRPLGLVILFGGIFGVFVGGYFYAGFVEDRLADLARALVAGGGWDEIFGVGAGDLQAVEEAGGLAEVDAVVGQGVDDDRDGELDGVAVFEGWEIELGEGGAVVGVEHAGVVLGENGLALHAVQVVFGDGMDDDWGGVDGLGAMVVGDLDVMVAKGLARNAG